MSVLPNEQAALYNFLSVSQFVAKHLAFTRGGVRAWIFNGHLNGLIKAGAIVRIGRKILIDETKFFAWIASQNKAVS